MAKSLLDYAYDYVSVQSQESKFADIWAYCVQESGISKEEADSRVSRFYTNLMLDGRFVTVGDNKWDLRTRQKFEKVHIDMSEVYSDVETYDEDSEEADEEEEYNSAFKDEEQYKDDDLGSESDDENNEDEEGNEF
ncbi:MAG: DNA-directed RNA polymerase subunit delta [Bacilli bacterium]|nr:DNA-directed RNA polymerase subunit delta [Bacilli bacterium]